MSTRKCGVCQKPPREGTPMFQIRIHAGEFKFDDGKRIPEAGLYNACEDCASVHRENISKKKNKKPQEVTRNELA